MKQLLVIISIVLSGGCTAFVPASSPLPTPTEAGQSFPPATLHPEQSLPIQRAITDLAQRLNLSADEISLVSSGQIELSIPDTACVPSEGDSARPVIPAQVLGLEIILSARGATYTYHARGAVLYLCSLVP